MAALGNDVVLGLLGTGKIGSAVMTGYCSPVAAKSTWEPKAIFVSPRGTEKAKALQAKFPAKVTIAATNQAVIDASNVIFIGLLPDVARQELPALHFPSHVTVISMMATIPYDELVQLVRLPKENVVRTVPLPSSSRRTGPILAYPKQSYVEQLLLQIGTPVMVDTESEVTTLTGMTAMISFFYATCGHLQQWCVNNGVEDSASRAYVASFFQSLADAGMVSTEAFHDMAEEAATPGGLNEQTHRGLTSSGAYDLMLDQVDAIFTRLTKAAPAPRR
ncbi:hypothetical protein SPRG_14949 [Saprolegnia parasitica CBS 223.65]|uniref:Pyrroline-5-carboxylate reductase catalytic N-terminal domain-containing protein n=2 Tax=Saprolegnia parasitica (strain CBS 223.65) TaxID=695850 RepID=A0A067BMY2_SAPPC|nr:hypothetical protein SPRG_14949 [Saprolegnia parasitica CBS 223.65]KDO19849.1 hypothetical protein SPRG_14949 [Saprolegnia parasitica CBS 223.65]|eukprot:XP_012209461.1 hypothetical protein SPRG_14949 [Saprolegnia parasitica CBS 223.65]